MNNATAVPKLSRMHYLVVRTLGTGAGSTIQLIADTQSHAHYALKVVNIESKQDETYLKQALFEFEVASKLRHPNVIRIYDRRLRRSWFRTTGVDLLMEYIPGCTLDELPELQVGPLVLVFAAVASALEHMHRRGVFHGDLKPGNIMVTREGGVKVIDLGTAWLKGQPKDRIQGTPQYMAPEQAREIVDARTDLYNLGATMYRMFTGQYANFVAPHELSTLSGGSARLGDRLQSVTPPIEINPALPGTLNETILSCLKPDPNQRPAGAFEVRAQLEAVARYLKTTPDELKRLVCND